MFDIGANIGLYSIYAALRGVTVVAFEPESQNYALLNRNVFLNQAQDRVTCLNVALSDTDGLVYLYIPVFEAGRALNNFESACVESAGSGKPEFKQGVIAFSLDSYLSRYPRVFPTHIKIDVDGAESKIVKGAAKTLQDERLLSVSLEIDESLPEHEELAPFIVSKGFTLTQKKHADMFDGTKYGKTYNYLFIRK
jgi:FkbM family methyltransferase